MTLISFRGTWPPEPGIEYVFTEPGLDLVGGEQFIETVYAHPVVKAVTDESRQATLDWMASSGGGAVCIRRPSPTFKIRKAARGPPFREWATRSPLSRDHGISADRRGCSAARDEYLS